MPLAAAERRVERFFLNVVLLRLPYAHALVSAPRLALRWLAPLGHPLGDDVESYIAAEHGFGHLLDIGVIQPRLDSLYRWSADELQLPGLRGRSGVLTECIHEGLAGQQLRPDRRLGDPSVCEPAGHDRGLR
jgi:hypothetical protein